MKITVKGSFNILLDATLCIFNKKMPSTNLLQCFVQQHYQFQHHVFYLFYLNACVASLSSAPQTLCHLQVHLSSFWLCLFRKYAVLLKMLQGDEINAIFPTEQFSFHLPLHPCPSPQRPQIAPCMNMSTFLFV